ncbi:MAG: hypothetical protein P4K78_14955 [Terracidiphilus sp.]|nr:hypothetical protein [Terracidiphilus sp.]
MSLATLLITSTSPRQVIHAQTAPAAGTRVVVKMVDTVDSASDSVGRQYRALVTAGVDAGKGVIIEQGSSATVTVTSSGSGYTAQLSSVTVNGQVVAVTSSSATLSGPAQNVQAKTTGAVTSVLGGLGHHVRAPANVASAAMGQHVFLPTGTTLTFVLGASPASSNGGPAAPPTAAPATPNGNPAQPPAQSSTSSGGALTAMEICFSNPPPNPSDSNYKTEFLTAVFEVPVDTLRAVPVLEPAFSAYLKTTYYYPSAGITCQPIWSIADAQTVQKKITGDRDRAKLKMVNTGWRYGQSPVTQGQDGFDPLVLGRGGLDLSQHRLTTYFCSLTAPGGTTMAVDMRQPNWNANMTTYVSQVFQADWDSAPVSVAYNVFIRDHYVHDLTLTDLSPRCSAQSPSMQTMQHQTAMISNKRIGHAVAVDFSDTPEQQAAAAHTSATPAAQPPSASSTGCRPGDRNPSCSFNQPQPGQAAQPTTSSAAGPFISCSTQGGAGIAIYVTGIFQTTKPVRHMPNGAKIVDQSILDDFHAYLTQKGYTFKPGSAGGCDVSPTEAAAETAQHTRIHGGSGSCGYCGNKVVETGWKE